MGAYFKNYNHGNFVEKVLMKKKKGSLYPSFNDFSDKINLLKEYLGDFVVDTEIFRRNNRYYLKQPVIVGIDLFIFLKNQPQKTNKQIIKQFVSCLEKLYKDTGILPDFIGNNNILFTKENKIKLIDVWPLFFHDRVIQKDLNEEGYKKKLNQLKFLSKF